jgi:ankyrin repeat protein
MVQILLEYGADVNIEVETGRPLWAAICSHNNSVSVIVDILLKSGADVNLPSKSGQGTPLQAAAAEGSFGIVKKLIDHGAIINAEGSPHTALCAAAIIGDVPTMRLLLDSGAHIQARDRCGKTPLHHAASGRHKDSNPARILLEHGAATNMRDAENWTPLHYAAAAGNQAVVELLLEMGADSEIEDNLGRKPLTFGSHNGSMILSSSSHSQSARVLSTPPPETPSSALVYMEECNSPASFHSPRGE